MANDFELAGQWLRSELDDIAQEVSMLVLEECITRSPVDTGRFRGNWIVSLRNPDDDESFSSSPLQRGSAVLDRGFAGRMKPKEIYIQNNLPYAGVIDDGLYPKPPKKRDGKTKNGYSKQAPRGISTLAIKAALERSNR